MPEYPPEKYPDAYPDPDPDTDTDPPIIGIPMLPMPPMPDILDPDPPGDGAGVVPGKNSHQSKF